MTTSATNTIQVVLIEPDGLKHVLFDSSRESGGVTVERLSEGHLIMRDIDAYRAAIKNGLKQ